MKTTQNRHEPLDSNDTLSNTRNINDIPSQKERTYIITGTGGLGYQEALALASVGAEVILAGRNSYKGQEAITKICQSVVNANVHFERLDLADLKSIDEFCKNIELNYQSVDVLINNAAVMALPTREFTADGFEMQFGTNFLGPFALTARLLPLLRKGINPRIITVSSIAARNGKIDFNNLQAEKTYAPMKAYAQSKLADLMLAFELQRRNEENQWGVLSIAAHPGVSRTDLITNGAGRLSLSGFMRKILWFMFQPAAQGALPTLFAATSSEAKGGAYYGPDKMNETRGFPAIAKIPPQAEDKKVARLLWDIAANLTNSRFL